MTDTVAEPPARPAGRWRPVVAIRAFATLLLAASAVLFAVVIVDLPAPTAAGLSAPLWALAIGFYLSEARVIHVHFRRESQAFGLNELPLVAGFYFARPSDVVLGLLLGYATALVTTRKQRGAKLAVNIGLGTLGAGVAVTVFGLATSAAVQPSPDTWVPAIAAACAASLVNTLAIALAVRLTEGAWEAKRLPQVILTAITQTVVVASLALVAVVLLVAQPWGLVLLALPLAGIYVAFRAYTAEKQKHQTLEFLYESTRILHGSPEVDSALRSLLLEAARTFRSQAAEVVVFPEDDSAPLRTVVHVLDAGDHSPEMQPLEDEPVESEMLAAASALPGAEVARSADQDPIGKYAAHRGYDEVMIVPLRGEQRLIGVLLVGERIDYAPLYEAHERRLFETLASNASVSLENTRLERTLSQLRELKDELRHQAHHDALTGLANRVLFSEEVEATIGARPAGACAVLYLDLDDFKSINDTLGHDAGDELLTHVAQRLLGSIRPTDLACRLGGDEFALLLRDVDDTDLPERVAERIMKSLRFPVHVEDRDVFVRTSIGIAVHEPGLTASELIRNADIAMYQAKQGSKGRFAVYHEHMHAALEERLSLREQLGEAVSGEEFHVHYQPLVELQTGAIVGAEALVRWVRQDGSVVDPDSFISLAEETGLVIPIGEHVLSVAAHQLAAWQERYGTGLAMTVNVSARQLRHDGFVPSVERIVAEAGIRPSSLILELTERDVMDDTETSLERLTALRATGVRLAIDDFGTGYSSLAYLQRFPIDIVKIAKEFVDDIGPLASGGGLLARAIIEMTDALGMSAIAEGIERQHQDDQLRAWGCTVGQGWLYAKATRPEELEGLLARERRPGAFPLHLVPDSVRDVLAD